MVGILTQEQRISDPWSGILGPIGLVASYLDEFRGLLAMLDTAEIARLVQTLLKGYRHKTRIFVPGNVEDFNALVCSPHPPA